MKFNALIPELTVSSINESKRFYAEVLGFKIEYERPERKFAFLSFGEAQLMIQELEEDDDWQTGALEKPFGRGINFEINCNNIEEHYENLLKKGVWIKIALKSEDYSGFKSKEFLLTDPDGYLLRFSEGE